MNYLDRFNSLVSSKIWNFHKKYAVITCIFGNYEIVHEIKDKNDDIDYILVTDNPNLSSNTWSVVYYKNYQELSLLHDKLSRSWWTRFNLFTICNAEYCLYLDGSITIAKDIIKIFKDFEKSGKKCGFPVHPERDNVFDEIEIWKKIRPDRGSKLQEQLDFFRKENFPKGLIEGGYYILKNCKLAKDILDLSIRLCFYVKPKGLEIAPVDQTLMTFAIYKNFGDGSDFLIYNSNFRHNEFLKICGHGTLTPYPLTDQNQKSVELFGKKFDIYYPKL